ncbi:rCG58359 [Rattus norvegicus]|uniref:RCG58359 n=1 Tax=Rattus norvegicus TaxID=10116 RepID=A6J482_RAT|nr:rCG58359 [Rattus norvegicus]
MNVRFSNPGKWLKRFSVILASHCLCPCITVLFRGWAECCDLLLMCRIW